MLPLDGIKTHPLSDHAWSVLRMLAHDGDMPTQLINAGVVNRLLREALVSVYLAPTPYRTRKGNINWLQITQAGLSRLQERQNRS